jgi:hypothetical protein
VQVYSRGGYDDLAFAAQKTQLAGGLNLARSPVASHSSCALVQSAALPGGAGDGSAPHQHLAIRAQLDFAAGQRLADGSPGYVERVVERDERGGFGHPVALHQDESQRVPELAPAKPGNAPPPEISAQNLRPKAE